MRSISVALLLPFSLVLSTAHAVGKYWVCGDGLWDDGVCWSLTYEGAGGAGEPITSGDTVRLWSDDGLDRVVTYQTSLVTLPVFSLVSLDAVSGGTMTLEQAGDSLSTDTAHIGSLGHGSYLMNGGDLTVSTLLAVGMYFGSDGSFDISGTATVDAAEFIVGNNSGSSGAVIQSGGAVSVTGDLVVGNLGTGSYDLAAGTLDTAATLLQAAGSGFTQSGGVHTTTGNLTVTAGNYALQDGDLLVGAVLDTSAAGFTQTGGNLSAGTIEDGTFILGNGATVNATNINGGDFSVAGGAVNASTLMLAGGDTLAMTSGTLDFTTFNLSGGAVTTDLPVPATGTLNYSSGTFAGRLTNNGVVVSTAADMAVADGMENNGSASGAGFTFDGAGLANNGALTFSTFLTGTGALVNDGQMTGNGSISGSGGFTNNAQFTQGGGDLVLDNTGGNISNGTLSLAFSRRLVLNEDFVNNGMLDLTNSTIAGPATLLVGITGTVSGGGTVFTAVDNAGTLQARSGNLVLSGTSLINSGLLRNTVGSNLFVDSASVTHTGNVEVNAAGSVVFSTALVNGAGQQLTLKGGALGAPTLTNASGGGVSGFGTISGDMVNAGSVDLFGASSLVGDLDNLAGGHFLVRNAQTLVTGHTTNDGTIETLNGDVIFEGGLTNNGALLFDPSTITLTTLSTGTTGYLAETGEPGDRFILQDDFFNASVRNTDWQTGNTIFQFNGNHDAADPQTLEVAGADLGNILAGWDDNFMFGTLEVGTSDTWLQLVDANDNSASCLGLATVYCEIWSKEALYVDDLILHAGVTLDLNGYNLYVLDSFSDFGATILNGSITVGAVPLPPALWLFGSGLLVLLCQRRRG